MEKDPSSQDFFNGNIFEVELQKLFSELSFDGIIDENDEALKEYVLLKNSAQQKVIASLLRNEINLNLRGSEIEVDWSSKNIELTEKRYLAYKVSLGLVELELGNNDLIIEAIASIGANYTLNYGDKKNFLEAILDILGTQQFNSIIEASNSSRIVDDVFVKEKQIYNLSKYSYIINNTVRSHLKKIGISENHDDFNGFCKDFTRLIIMSNNASADVIMSPVYKSLNEKIDRLGINDEIENLFKIFGLEEDE